ncbi:protein naked cuticle homolog 2-like isoform X2 [Gigantopelta aegis]|uniref:protein naked cuticle homolog 2-like isoform X2 n=1 Tax=Gigantopelta aegis TaxID=1735272 RepID=UPI001B88A22F|nr:protein naked cuticle homolog 2-like isoform X2 [Gigantopelta aegis]
MMGKLQSKHAECYFVNGHLNTALEEQIWKKKTGFNLANYNMDENISELSICLEDKETGIPLQVFAVHLHNPFLVSNHDKVDLPPQKTDTETGKVLRLDTETGKVLRLNTETGKVLRLDQMTDDCLKKDEKGNNEDKLDRTRLSIEEFECGVQFEGSENSKQEWSFTLYDFDGHGRITKEDLASLLKALYDAVGSSIKLPENGTKTLKLRLTVGQDNTQIQLQQATSITTAVRGKENAKVKNSCQTKDTGKVREFSKLNNLTGNLLKCNNETAQGQGQGQQTESHCMRNRNQLSVRDQQQLVELVQENMERNHIKQLRRHHSDCRNMSDHPHHHKRRHRNHCSHNLDEKPKESQDRRNYYLDLAGVENNTSKFQNNPSVPTAGSGFVQTGHHRSRSHDVATTKKYDNVQRESERLEKHLVGVKEEQHTRSRSFDPQEVGVHSPKGQPKVLTSPHKHGGGGGKFRPVSLPAHVTTTTVPATTMSPHYHRRHRHREKDHGLAMQQVAEWIEREHSWEVEGERLVVQRHEHHHIHEHHHHHHYHHYYEA